MATPARNEAARGFTRHQGWNRVIVAQLLRHREALRTTAQVAITGLDVPRHPWMFGEGRFVDALLGHDVRWLVVAEPDSFASWVYAEFGRSRDNPGVAVIGSPCLPMLDGMPKLRFASDLSARVIPAASDRRDGGDRARIDFGATDHRGRLCHGWSAPEALTDPPPVVAPAVT